MEHSYDTRVTQQIAQFDDTAALWKLPPIHRYWMSRHIRPRFQAIFESHSMSLAYYEALKRAAEHTASGRPVLYSLGAGDCQTEVELAVRLARDGISNGRVVCLELSPIRLERGRKRAAENDVSHLMEFVEADLNQWRSQETVDVFIAHHTLHHVVELEHLFDAVQESMSAGSVFLTADVIGRNGHQRWPETLKWVEHLWRVIPDRYKYQFQFNEQHESFVNWDCSTKGFEGIRAQDVLPQLVRRFDYDSFVGYGGIIDPFIERGYGQNLDPQNPADTGFIDFVEDINQVLLDHRAIKPTMMMASFRTRGGGRNAAFRGLTPELAIRPVT